MSNSLLGFLKAAGETTAILFPIVMAIVELSKGWGLQGKWLTVLSFVLGIIMGITSMVALYGVPVENAFFLWFSYVIVGLVVGLTASKVYDAVRSAANPGP